MVAWPFTIGLKIQDIALWFPWGSSASHCNVTKFISYHNRFINHLKVGGKSAPQYYCKRCWNQIRCFIFPAPCTFQSRILSIPLPVCPLSRNKIQRMPDVFCSFLIWLLVQGHVSAKHVSICLSLAAFRDERSILRNWGLWSCVKTVHPKYK